MSPVENFRLLIVEPLERERHMLRFQLQKRFSETTAWRELPTRSSPVDKSSFDGVVLGPSVFPCDWHAPEIASKLYPTARRVLLLPVQSNALTASCVRAGIHDVIAWPSAIGYVDAALMGIPIRDDQNEPVEFRTLLREIVMRQLVLAGGNKSAAARDLGMVRQALQRRVRESVGEYWPPRLPLDEWEEDSNVG